MFLWKFLRDLKLLKGSVITDTYKHYFLTGYILITKAKYGDLN